MPSLSFFIPIYFVAAWLFGVILYWCMFVKKDRSMGGNSGVAPIDYHTVELPNLLGSLLFLMICLVWPISLVVLVIIGIIKAMDYISASTNHAIPRFIRFVFMWPVYLVSLMFDINMDVEK